MIHVINIYLYIPKMVLSITATSVASERTFSTAGNIIDEKRFQVTPLNFNKLIIKPDVHPPKTGICLVS